MVSKEDGLEEITVSLSGALRALESIADMKISDLNGASRAAREMI